MSISTRPARFGRLHPVSGLVCTNINEERCRTSTKLVDGELRVVFYGDAETTLREKVRQLLAQIDSEALRLKIQHVFVDFCSLGFITSTCFKAFVTWIDRVKEHKQYRVRFASQDGQTWHRRSLSALRAFAPDLVTIEVREGRAPGVVDIDESVILATSDQVFVFLDRTARCSRVTIGGAALPALDFERWLGQLISDCFADARPKLIPALDQARASSRPQRIDVAIPDDDPAGRTRLFEVTVVPLPTGSSVALRDVTDSTEATKLAARLEHDEMLDALGILTGSLAHDFNNVLVTISSFAERATIAPSAAQMREYLDAILGAVRRGRDLTSNLASFARGGDLSLRSVELAPLLEEIATTLRAFRPEWEIVVTAPPGGARVRGDASQLHRALLNVGKNAIEAIGSRATARIELSLELRQLTAADAAFAVPPGAYALVRVEDEGCGIEEATKARLFDPFFSGKPLGHGSGLGLFAVNGIARAHGGGVQVTSVEGRGTAFVIALPLIDEPRQATWPPPIRPSTDGPPPPKRASMLVVDDDPNVGKSLKLLLEGLGHDVVLERDPEAALDRFKTSARSFDLVLTDLSMPKLDGISFAQELTRLGHVSPIVLVTGRDAFLKPEALDRAKIAGVLPKPFTLNELETIVARLLPSAEVGPSEPPASGPTWTFTPDVGAARS
jgi:signal transduction histidine kinase/CheY-like chemotaxis protein